MNDNDRNKVQRLIGIYERRIENIERNIKADKPTGETWVRYKMIFNHHKEFLADLNSLVSPKPSRFKVYE